MNQAIVFDTHRFVERLTGNGFSKQQAEVLADEQVNLLDGNLATKTDLAQVEAGLKVEIEAAKVGLIKWVTGMILAIASIQTAVMVAAMRFM